MHCAHFYITGRQLTGQVVLKCYIIHFDHFYLLQGFTKCNIITGDLKMIQYLAVARALQNCRNTYD